MVQVVTYDASRAAGAAPSCIQNTWTFFQSLMAARNDKAWWGVVSEAFNTCQPLASGADVENLAYWVQVTISCGKHSGRCSTLPVTCRYTRCVCEMRVARVARDIRKNCIAPALDCQ